MSHPSSFSFRGRKAHIAIRDDRDQSIVRRQLGRLGVETECWDFEANEAARADVFIIDDDYLPATTSAQRARLTGAPVIALVGTETPSRLKMVLELDPASFLVKPLRSAGIYAALVMAFDRIERTHDLKQQIAKLEERIRSRRLVLAAVLQVMESRRIGEPAAFALIRRIAMEQRKTIEQVSAEISATGRLPISALG